MKRTSTITIGLFLLLVGIWHVSTAQEQFGLRITEVDKSGFPLVRVNLITSDSHGAPLTDLSALTLRENGIPIGDLEINNVSIGSNVIFVLDASSSFEEVDDDSGLSRLEKVRQSILRYGRQFMADGDKVTIVVPDDALASGRFLVEDEGKLESVIGALEAYDPEALGQTPLQEMMLLALAHAADGIDDGRYHAILLFSDGGQLQRQLTYSTLLEQAENVEIPIFAALLGARADPNEIENVTRLTDPTHATFVHMPDPAETDPIFSIWRRQGDQTQISYRSLQSKSGRYPITVNLGSARALAELVLEIAPPVISFEDTETQIRRAGSASDTPLTSLTPTVLPVHVILRWMDDQPRPLVAANLFVDGQLAQLPATLEPDAGGRLSFEWNITNLDEGTYSLVVQVTDELGISAVSESLPVTVTIERPPPPTPTSVPTPVPDTEEAPPQISMVETRIVIALGGVAVVALLLLAFLRRRRRKVAVQTAPEPQPTAAVLAEPLAEAVGSLPQVAYLEMLGAKAGNVSRIRIEGESVTIGRDHHVAQIVFDDDSVAQLHAQIRKRNGRYWLYDEGSAEGTFHNYERLGLAPRPLTDQDTIHFGHVGLRFHMMQMEESAKDDE